MSESLTDLLATDAQLDAIAARAADGPRDLVLAELALFAAALDDVPLPPVILPAAPPAAMSTVRKGGWALSVTVALMVTSSGVAAAVSEDPLAPLHYVTTQVWKIGPHNGAKLPGWELDGAMPISTVPGVGLHVPRGGPSGGAASGSGSGEIGFGQVGTGHGSAIGRGPGAGQVGGQGGPGGHGGRPPSSVSGHGSNGNSGGEPPGSGGRRPDNSTGSPGLGSNGPGGPSGPRAPHLPAGPGVQNGHSGQPYHPGEGPVLGGGTGSGPGAHQCRIDHPSIPGSSWGSAPLHSCRPHLTPPDRPPSSQAPRVRLTPPPTSSTGSSAAGSSPSESATTPTPTGTTPTPKP
jgi:hypothetical protein